MLAGRRCSGEKMCSHFLLLFVGEFAQRGHCAAAERPSKLSKEERHEKRVVDGRTVDTELERFSGRFSAQTHCGSLSRTCLGGGIQPTKPVFVRIGYGEPATKGPPVRLRTATRDYQRAIMTPIRLSIWPNSATVKRMGPIWPSPWTRALCLPCQPLAVALQHPLGSRDCIRCSSSPLSGPLTLQLPREHSPTTKPFTGFLRATLLFSRSPGRALLFTGGPRGPRRACRRSCN